MGEWRTSRIGYLTPFATRCALTGQLLPGRHWQAEVEGRTLQFVDQRAERLYRTYWLPRYGGAKEEAR